MFTTNKTNYPSESFLFFLLGGCYFNEPLEPKIYLKILQKFSFFAARYEINWKKIRELRSSSCFLYEIQLANGWQDIYVCSDTLAAHCSISSHLCTFLSCVVIRPLLIVLAPATNFRRKRRMSRVNFTILLLGHNAVYPSRLTNFPLTSVLFHEQTC